MIVLALFFAPMMALAGGGGPDPAIGPRMVCAVANTCASQRQPTSSSARSAPFDSDAASRRTGRPVAQSPENGIAIWMSPLLHTQGHASDANRGSIRAQHPAPASLVLNLAPIRGDSESGTGTGTDGGGFASRVHLLSRGNGGQSVHGGIAYTVSGKEYIAVARWHRRPAFVVVFALP